MHHPSTAHTAISSSPPASSTSEELMAVFTTFDELSLRALTLTRGARELMRGADVMTHIVQDLQLRLPKALDKQNKDTAADNVWVRAVAKTPPTVTAEHTHTPDGHRIWYVVFVGREPGLYNTVEEANTQIKGCPNQQYRSRMSKCEALDAYSAKYEAGEVAKWVEFKD
ncbi:hypothetical protein B0H14DRAFT_3473648 [Mycena olivaceomarginata]|nr:hypothetical protein B0H14DRAFT_3473648 [Mycena olivaceomarginata]